MTFIESIQVSFKKYAAFNGCASRPEFWWWALTLPWFHVHQMVDNFLMDGERDGQGIGS